MFKPSVIGLVSVNICTYVVVIKKKIVIERTRDLIYLKFVATDFFLKITRKMVPITGRASSFLEFCCCLYVVNRKEEE